MTISVLPSVTAMQAAVTATGNGTSLDVGGYDHCNLSIFGDFVGSVTLTISYDGTTYVSTDYPVITASGIYTVNCKGAKYLRAAFTRTSGTLNVYGLPFTDLNDNNAEITKKAVEFSSNSAISCPRLSAARPANTTAYTIGDMVGATAALSVLPSAVPAATTTYVLDSLLIKMASASGSGWYAHIFLADKDVGSTYADNAAFSVAAADLSNYLGAVAMDTFSNGASFTRNLNIPIKLTDTSLRIILQTGAVFTPTSGEVIQYQAMGWLGA